MHWLERLIERITSVIPRIWLVGPDEAGVRVTLGTRIKDTPPGWYFHWPFIQTAEKIKIRQQIVDLRPQSLRTQDRCDLIISGAIKYKITDARKAILDVFDYDESIQALALGVIQQHVAQHIFGDIDGQLLAAKILDGLRKASEGWGLKLQAVYITDIGKTRNLRLLWNQNLMSGENN